MAKVQRQKKCPEGEECPEWIFTFADLVMLMMGFFVILWVLKPAGKPTAGAAGEAKDEKWLETVGEIRKAFNYVPDPDSKDPVDKKMITLKLGKVDPPFKGPGAGGQTKELKKAPDGTDPLVTIVRPGKHVGVGGRLGFSAGDAALRPETQAALDEVTALIRGHRNIVQIKGHTALDDLPEGSTEAQRMELSVRRAQAAADYLAARGVSPDTMRVQGCSTFEPVVERAYGPDAQAANRRVEIESTDQLVYERQDKGETAAPIKPTKPKASGGE